MEKKELSKSGTRGHREYKIREISKSGDTVMINQYLQPLSGTHKYFSEFLQTPFSLLLLIVC